MDLSYDVVVVGGGPAGATVATLLAQKGRRVLVVERTRFPRFHIGESLMPDTYWTFKRLGMLPKLKASHFVKKYSVQFTTPTGRESQPFYFDEINPHESSQTWQVVRSEFDKMMLENAREHGAEVWENSNVSDILSEPCEHDTLPRVTGVVASKEDGPSQRISAKVVVDATGVNAMLSRRFNLRKPDPKMRKAAYFAHYKGARRDAGRDEGATLVLSNKSNDGWFWYIPLPNDVISIGVVGDLDRLMGKNKASPEDTLQTEIDNCISLIPRMTNAKRTSEVHVLSDFSFRSSRCAGDGWALVGDAFGFLDPMYSSGVFLALKSGEMAADAINEGFDKNDLSGAQLGIWGQEFADGMQAIRKLVYAFYSPQFSFGKFVRAYPHYKKTITDLLIGNVFYEGVNEIFETMKKDLDLPDSIPLEAPPTPQYTSSK